MFKRSIVLPILLIAVFSSGPATINADMFTPSTSCSKPYKPFSFNSQWELDSFNDEVEAYRRCIEDFVDEQQSAIDRHRQAADDAIDEWNSFVRYELN